MADESTDLAQFKNDLGPDLDFVADALAPAVTRLVDRVSQTTVEKTIAPIRAASDRLLTREAAAAATAILRSFGESYPDWKTHEPAMLALAQKVQSHGLSEPEYLDLLYKSVTREKWDAEREATVEAAVVDRVAKSTRQTRPAHAVSFERAFADAKEGIRHNASDDGDSDDQGDTSTPAQRPAGASIRDAFRAAVAGVRWE